MGKSAVEKPVAVPVQKVAPDPAQASQHVQGGLELLNLIAPGNFIQPSSTDTSGLKESIWQPMIEALLLQAGTSVLDWVWQGLKDYLKDYFAEPLALLNGFQQLATVLVDPKITLLVKSKALLDFLDAQPHLKPAITPYIAIAQRLHHILEVQQQRAAFTLAHSVLTLKSLVALAHMPEVQALAGKHTLAPVQNLLRGALEMGQTWLQLSQTSWDSPASFLEDLRKADVLPGWVNEIVEQGQRLYETLNALPSRAQSIDELENTPSLERFLTQFNESSDPLEKFTALFYLLVDDTALPILNKYAGDAFGGLFKVFAFLKEGLQIAAQEDTSGLSATLLTLDHYTSKPFIARISGAGEVGQTMAEPLSLAHAALRGSAKQEAGMNMVLRLFDPKQTWTRFAKESIAVTIRLPEKGQVWKLLTTVMFRYGKVMRALWQVLDYKFWQTCETARWNDLPALIAATLKRDLEAPNSKFVLAQSIASGVPEVLIQPFLTATVSIIGSWKGDNWSDFLTTSTQSVQTLVTTMAKNGQLLSKQMQKILDTCLLLTKNVARLINLWSLWHATQDKKQMGDESVALIRQLLVEHADDTAVWAFDKALVWLPVLPGLYRVLKHVPPIEAGQRIQWVTRLLVSLYTQPEVQANPEIIQLREQVQRIAQEWLGAIPDAVLGKAVIEEVEAQPGPVQKAVIKSLYFAIDAAPPLLRLMKSAVSYASAGLLGDVIRGLLQPQASLVPLIMFLAVIPERSTDVEETPRVIPEPTYTAPVLWGVGAVATFLAGIVLAYKAYESYRDGGLAAQKDDDNEVEMDALVKRMEAGTKDDQPITTSPEKSLLLPEPEIHEPDSSDTPNPNTSSTPPKPKPPIKGIPTHWKRTGLWTGASVLMFSASAFAMVKTYNATRESRTLLSSETAQHIEQQCDTLQILLAAATENEDNWLANLTTEVEKLNANLVIFDLLTVDQQGLLDNPSDLDETLPPDNQNISTAPPEDSNLLDSFGGQGDISDIDTASKSNIVKRSIIIPSNRSYDSVMLDITNTKNEIANLINNLSTLTQDISEPFIENNKKWQNRTTNHLLPFVLTPETLTQYNRRINNSIRRINTVLRPSIIAKTAQLSDLFTLLNKTTPPTRSILFFEYSGITPRVPINGITTAKTLVAYPWRQVLIDTSGKITQFPLESSLIVAMLYCDDLIAEIVRNRDTHPMSATPQIIATQRNQDLMTIFDTREIIQDLIEYQFINNERVDGRKYFRKSEDREEFMLSRIEEILTEYAPGVNLDADSSLDVEFYRFGSIQKESFKVVQIAKGIHKHSRNARAGAPITIDWAELTSATAQELILSLENEWLTLKKMNRLARRNAELINNSHRPELRKYDIHNYSRQYIDKLAASLIPNPEERTSIGGSTHVWEKRETIINKDNKKQKPQLPKYQPTTLLELLWGITQKKRLYDSRTKITYSHSPTFRSSTETGAAKVAKAIIYTDFYSNYRRDLQRLFQDANTRAEEKEMMDIKLRNFSSYAPFSLVLLDNQVLPGVISGFRDINHQLIYSLAEDRFWTYNNINAVHDAYKKNTDDFKTSMESRRLYSETLKKRDTDSLTLSFSLVENLQDKVLDHLQERYLEEADLLTNSRSELDTMRLLEQLKFGWSLASLLTGPLTKTSAVLGLLFGPIAPTIQSFVADLPDEKEAYLWEATVAGVAELFANIPNYGKFLKSDATKKALRLNPEASARPNVNTLSESSVLGRQFLLDKKQPLVIPLSGLLLKTEQFASSGALANAITVLPGPFKEDQWRKKELWTNGFVFTQFEALNEAGYISLKDNKNQYLKLTADPTAEASRRWKFEYQIEQGSNTPPTLLPGSRQGETMAQAMIRRDEILSKILSKDLIQYEVYSAKSKRLLSFGHLIFKEPLAFEGRELFDKIDQTSPESGAYADVFFSNFDIPRALRYFTKYFNDKKITGATDVNALLILDYLISYHSLARPPVWPSRYSQTVVDTLTAELANSQVLVEILIELLMLNEEHEYRIKQPPLSIATMKNILQLLAAQAAKDAHYKPVFEAPASFSRGSEFLNDLDQLKKVLTPDLATWLVIINYSEGAGYYQTHSVLEPPGPFATDQHSESSDTASDLRKNVLSHDIDQTDISLDVESDPVLPLVYAKTFVDHTPAVGVITARYYQNKPIPVSDGESVRIRVSRPNGRDIAQKPDYLIPPGSYGPHALPHFIAGLINRDFDKKIKLSNSSVRLFAGTRKEVFDTHNEVTGYTYSLEVADKIYIYSNINLLIPGDNGYEVIIEFINEYGLFVD